MEDISFEKFCERNFKKFTDDVRKSIKTFPASIDVDKGDVLSDDKLRELMQKPVDLFVSDSNELYYINNDKEKVFIDPRIEDDKILKGFVGDVYKLLPIFPFDLQCGGIKRKQQEVASAYKACIVNAFQKGAYKKDLDEVIEDYDFSGNKSKKEGGKTFSDVLKLMQEDATPITKFIITVCSSIIGNSKEKNEALYIGIVSLEDQEVLEQIINDTSSIEYACNQKVSQLEKKIDRLNAIVEKEEAIEEVFKIIDYDKSLKFRTLFRIHRINSTNLNPTDIATIKQTARKMGRDALEKGELQDFDYFKKYVTKQSSKAIRILVRDLKEELFIKFNKVENDEYDALIPKN